MDNSTSICADTSISVGNDAYTRNRYHADTNTSIGTNTKYWVSVLVLIPRTSKGYLTNANTSMGTAIGIDTNFRYCTKNNTNIVSNTSIIPIPVLGIILIPVSVLVLIRIPVSGITPIPIPVLVIVLYQYRYRYLYHRHLIRVSIPIPDTGIDTRIGTNTDTSVSYRTNSDTSLMYHTNTDTSIGSRYQ